ncbi:hypothetical protein SLEP1_g11973 [Rubroshorea leprosula]|nr:hypothetical protein SLEP1_g11973 [Rubroshorea leprosula]
MVELQLLFCPIGSNIVVRTAWFPMYYHFKFAFLVWLQLPSTEYRIVKLPQQYGSHLRPFLLRHQARVDQLTGLAYAGMMLGFFTYMHVRLISVNQEEIHCARAIMGKITASADHILRGSTEAARPRHPRDGIGDQTELLSDPDDHRDWHSFSLFSWLPKFSFL